METVETVRRGGREAMAVPAAWRGARGEEEAWMGREIGKIGRAHV